YRAWFLLKCRGFAAQAPLLRRQRIGNDFARCMIAMNSNDEDKSFYATQFVSKFYLSISNSFFRTTGFRSAVGCPVFIDALGWTGASVQMRAGNDAAERIILNIVTGNYFDMLGVRMTHGRSFSKEEKEQMGAGNVVVLGHAYWRRRFHSDPDVVGSIIRLNTHSFTIIGVASPEFSTNSSLMRQTMFVPVTGIDYIYPDYSKSYLNRRRSGEFNFVGRLRPGITLEEAQNAIAGSALFLLVVTVIAVFTPAWRAMRVDPLVALRSE
ncbi:MAG: ABC transporter permease, partial [Acidobacteriota bacterium]